MLLTLCATIGLLTIIWMGDIGGSEEPFAELLVTGRGDMKRPGTLALVLLLCILLFEKISGVPV